MKLYSFKMSDGQIEILSMQDAVKHLGDPLVKSRFEEILLNSKNVKRKKDGFESGWQENIQAYAGGQREYSQMLKDKGLVEIGRNYIPQESVGEMNYCHSLEFAQELREQGVELNDTEIDAIASGEYFNHGDQVE